MITSKRVYHELRVRGFSVSIGKVGDQEVDFIAEKHDRFSYPTYSS